MSKSGYYNSGYKYYSRESAAKNARVPLSRLFKKVRQSQVKGVIRIGHVKGTNIIFGIHPTELVQHLLLVGRSGSGKTNTLRVIQTELNRLGIPFICFDLAKYGGRFLKKMMPDLIVLRWKKEFYFNPLPAPPGVDRQEWLMAFSEITTEIIGLRTAGKLNLTKTLLNNECKNLADLLDVFVQRLKHKIPINERNSINTIVPKIETIILALGKMIDVEKGIPIEDLLKYPVCIELVGIKNTEIQFWIISLILAWIAAYRETRPMGFGKLKHVFFFDEAAKVLGKSE